MTQEINGKEIQIPDTKDGWKTPKEDWGFKYSWSK